MPIFKCDSNDEATPELALDEVVCGLRQVRYQWREGQARLHEQGGRHLPSPQRVAQAMHLLSGALFPMRLGPDDLHRENEDFYVGYTLGQALNVLQQQTKLEIKHRNRQQALSEEAIHCQSLKIIESVAAQLPKVRALIDADVLAAFRGDPAATGVDEVLLCYPGIQAMIFHRVAHLFYQQNMVLLARIIAELAHSQCGIDIHPGAQIGAGFFIDHGTGVVIGETAIIGQNVRIYQQVTLGARSFPSDGQGNIKKGLLRHPIVEDDVVIYAGATILGRITIGKGSVIGGNVWITKDVPAGSIVTQTGVTSEPCGQENKA